MDHTSLTLSNTHGRRIIVVGAGVFVCLLTTATVKLPEYMGNGS